MRGQILGVDRDSGEGLITGDDGRRYRFRQHDWGDRVGPAVGAQVDFEANDNRAVAVYRVPGTVPATVGRDRPERRFEKNRIVAALLAVFLGPLGIHRFYLGRNGSAVVMLVLTLTLVGAVVSGLWALIDAVRFLLMSDGEFEHRYGPRP